MPHAGLAPGLWPSSSPGRKGGPNPARRGIRPFPLEEGAWAWREKAVLSQSGGAPGGWGVERRQNVGCPSHFVSHPRTNVSLPSENVRRPSQNVDPPSNYVRSPSNYVCLPIMFLGLLGCGVSGFWNGGVSSWDRGLRFSGCKCNAFREFGQKVVPEGHPIIAQRFNGGLGPKRKQVPKGR